MSFEPIIGLEVHVQLNTNTKMFCACSSNYLDVEPNTYVCNVCLGLPGSLPSVNYEAVISAIKLGLSLNCKISNLTKFDRKNYVYPDLMKGYQISQLDYPIAIEGNMKVKNVENKFSDIRINRVHMEEDVAKLIHDEISGEVLVDLNRSGMPLLEVVTEPDFRSAVEAENYLTNLQSIVRYLEIGNANMEEGSFRCDANVSIRKKGTNVLNEKVEIKNMNRIKAVSRAIEYEIKRQTSEVESGNRIIQETRGWDDIKSESIPQRSKEDAHDYRYFPEPDLPVIKLNSEDINKIKNELPELPEDKFERYVNNVGISEYDARIIISNKNKTIFFEDVINNFKNMDPKLVSNWLNVEINGVSNSLKDYELEKMKLSSKNFGKLINLVSENQINKNSGKEILSKIYITDEDPVELVNKMGLKSMNNKDELVIMVKDVLSDNNSAIEDYKKGKENAVRFLIGQVMKKSRGTANPADTEEEIIGQLNEE
ncbi:MAG: Asp-tRNA(Asn)/Glu-tRNA(Gln) amidotransferase subunit GatB [Chloroflexota bacterium]|nr:Asp-tRNA(Asn)/Glu-tRNA(Gln) amidotransferase subunit GatB [Chloroflexota bacterium]